MSPSFLTQPEKTQEFKQGYREGFEAGKSSLKRELKELIAQLPDKQLFTETSSTDTNHYQI